MPATVYRPGSQFVREASPPAGRFPTDVAVGFMVGFAEKGPTVATLLTSEQDYETVYGGGSGVYATLHDSVAQWFAGPHGQPLWVGRVVGPTPVAASVTIVDGSSDDSITFTASSVGAWANGATGGVDVVVANATSGASKRKITITVDDTAVETYDELADVTAIVAALDDSDYGSATDEGGALPAVGTYPLTAGTDDNGNATDASWATALDLLGPELGTGRVAAPGRTSSTAHAQLNTHAIATNRVPFFDVASSASVSAATAARDAIKAIPDLRGGIARDWTYAVVDGVQKAVPGSVFAMATSAVSLSSSTARERASWPFQDAPWVAGLVDELTESERDELNTNGVLTARTNPTSRLVQMYSWRAATQDVNWTNLAHHDLWAEVEAETRAIQDSYIGQSLTIPVIEEATGAISSTVLAPRFTDGLLDGRSPDGATNEARYAYSVDGGPTVNTPTTIDDRVMNHRLPIRPSEHVELSRVVTTKIPITGNV